MALTNLYIILEMDPEIDDPQVLEAALGAKQNQWSLDACSSVPALELRATQALKDLDEYRRILRDPDLRAKQAHEARVQLRRDAEQARDTLQKILTMRRHTDDVLETSEMGDLAAQAGGSLVTAEVEQIARGMGFKVVSSRASTDTSASAGLDLMDAQTADRIQTSLDKLGHESLYEFLGPGFNDRTSRDELRGAASKRYSDLRMKADSPEVTIGKSLAAQCQTVFKTGEQKKKYDSTLAVQGLETRGFKAILRQAGEDGLITPAEMEQLLEDAPGGVSKGIAQAYIEAHAARRGWKILPPTDGAYRASRLLQCGYCGLVARDLDATHCWGADCGHPLVHACPRCKHSSPTADPTCTRCGFQIGNAPLVDALVKKGKALLHRGEAKAALVPIREALRIWPESTDAEELRLRATKIEREQQSTLSQLEGLVRERDLEKARDQAAGLKRRAGGADLDELERRIESGLKRANEAYERGNALARSGKVDEAVDRFAEALGHCRDFRPAVESLRSYPPPAPPKLWVHQITEGFSLDWEPAPSRAAITYHLVRKDGGTPTSATDGTVLGAVEGTRFEDRGARSGKAWFYAVYTERAGVRSSRAATAGPHVLVAEVADLTVEAGDGQVTLRWSPPAGSYDVEVWRAEGLSPRRRGEGTRLEASETHAFDGNLRNGTRYGYRVIAVYADPRGGGGVLRSAGVQGAAVPVAPPQPVMDLTASRDDDVVVLTWSPPPAPAGVQILRTTKPPRFSAGRVLPLQEAARQGTLVSGGSGRAQAGLGGTGRVFFVPLSVVEGTAVVGEPVVVTNVPDVDNLTAETSGNRIALSWTWPKGAQIALLTCSHEGYANGPEDEDVARYEVTRQAYERVHGWEFRRAPKKRHYFTVFVKEVEGGHFSTGVKTLVSMGQVTTVSYRVRIERTGWLTKKIKAAHVELRCSEPLSLRDVQVRWDAARPPLFASKGTLIEKASEVIFDDGEARIAIPAEYTRKRGFIKLFFVDPAKAEEVRLQPGSRDELAIEP